MENKQPELKGVIQTANDNKQKMGEIALWTNQSDNPNAPKYIGEMKTSQGIKFRIALWLNDRRRGRSPSS